jgi:hypothetical protein
MSPNLAAGGAADAAELTSPKIQWRRRYTLELELRYKLWLNERVTELGFGKTRAFGDGLVLVSADHKLPKGFGVELAIEWPAQIAGVCPLDLKIYGQTVGDCEEGSVVKITDYEFFARGNRPLRRQESR